MSGIFWRRKKRRDIVPLMQPYTDADSVSFGWLLEDGSGFWLLEDASGVWLLEEA